nr:ATP-dependent Clp protease ATP-binding subunit ClpA [uncultured Holophaga sp.]
MSNSPRVTDSLQRCIQHAFHLALASRHEYLTLEHMLLALQHDASIAEAIRACGGDPDAIKNEVGAFLLEQVESLPKDAPLVQPIPTVAFNRVMERAVHHALSSESMVVDPGSFLAAMLPEKESQAAWLLRQQGVTRLPLLRHLSHGAKSEAPEPGPGPESREEGGEEAPRKDPLQAYAVDLVAKAREGRIDPLIGRGEELERVVRVLCRRRKNNPLLIGEAGVGKTAIAEGLALRIAQGEVPEAIQDAPFYALDLGALLAGTRYRGDFEQRIKQVLEALARKPGALLFIDEIHTLVGAGSVSGGSLDASNLLKPALQSGELRCIGATTYQDVKNSVDKDRALARRFQKVEVGEPSAEDCLGILKGLRSHYEAHHKVRYTDEALESAVQLSIRHLRDLQLPDKAIDVLDEAGATQRLLPTRKRRRVVGVPEIEAVVARMARVPVQTVSRDDRSRLSGLESSLKALIYGQDAAVDAVVSAIKLSRSGLRGHERPMGSFLFTGPTGVGKTELTRQLAQTLGVPFLRFDMSEYMEKHAVSRLIGAPPGYVGFEDGGLLVDAVRKSPHAVVLLDEIEKAHPDLFAILLQVMDHATLTDNHGRKADFRHVVLVMTTNAGARDLSQRRLGFAEAGTGASSRGAIERTFTPEFRNRLDGVISFAPLGREEILRVVDKNLKELQILLDEKKVELKVDPEVREWLADKGFDPAFGARPMARLVEERLKRPLAEEILFGRLQKGGRAKVVLEDGEPCIR